MESVVTSDRDDCFNSTAVVQRRAPEATRHGVTSFFFLPCRSVRAKSTGRLFLPTQDGTSRDQKWQAGAMFTVSEII